MSQPHCDTRHTTARSNESNENERRCVCFCQAPARATIIVCLALFGCISTCTLVVGPWPRAVVCHRGSLNSYSNHVMLVNMHSRGFIRKSLKVPCLPARCWAGGFSVSAGQIQSSQTRFTARMCQGLPTPLGSISMYVRCGEMDMQQGRLLHKRAGRVMPPTAATLHTVLIRTHSNCTLQPYSITVYHFRHHAQYSIPRTPSHRMHPLSSLTTYLVAPDRLPVHTAVNGP